MLRKNLRETVQSDSQKLKNVRFYDSFTKEKPKDKPWIDIYRMYCEYAGGSNVLWTYSPQSIIVYAEACDDMKLENWLLCHAHAYSYFGGVTRLLIPDNLKTGVTKNTRYETVLNRSYQELAEHYDTAIVPARVEHPKDKPLAEGTVKFASTWILAALRDRRFFSIREAQEAVAEKLEELNDRPFKKREGCRRSAFLTEEQEFMKPLPTAAYEPAVWPPDLTVGPDYLVSDGILYLIQFSDFLPPGVFFWSTILSGHM